MDYDELRRWLWADPTAGSPESPELVLGGIEGDHLSSVRTEHRQTQVRLLRQSDQSPADAEVVPRRVESPSPCTVPELLARHGRVLVVGGRGAGKTALIAHLASRVAADGVPGTRPFVPFVVPVGLLSEPRLDERTIARLSPIGGVRLVRCALEEQRALVLVDGLDEAGDDARALSESIEAFARAHPGNRMVVTTRPRRTGIPGYTRVEMPGFVTATLFPPPSIRVYAAHRFLWRRYPERRATLVAANVDALLRSPAGDELPAASLLGSLDLRQLRILFGAIAAIMHYQRTVEIPVDLLITTLQERLLGARLVDGQRLVLDTSDEQIRDDEDELGGDDDEGPVERETAGGVHREGEPVQDIKGLVERIVEEIRFQRGLLIERRSGFFLFADLAYQDYLNAQEQIRLDTLDELIEMREDAWWHDAFVFVAGAPEVDAEKFIQKILDADVGEAPVATLIAARCAEVAAGRLTQRLRRTISRRLAELVPPRNELNVAHLIEVGEIVGPALLQALGSATPSERVHTAAVLGNLCYRPAFGVLMRMAADPTPVKRSITYLIWTDDLVAKNHPVGHFALAALLNIALTSTAARRSFEQALERVPKGVLQHFYSVVEQIYEINPVTGASQRDRDIEVVRVLLTKMWKALQRSGPVPPRPPPRYLR